MSFTLSPKLQEQIEKLIASGRYASADDVVNDGLRLLDTYERKRRELQQDIDEGVRDAAEGRVKEGPFSDLLAELEAELHADQRH